MYFYTSHLFLMLLLLQPLLLLLLLFSVEFQKLVEYTEHPELQIVSVPCRLATILCFSFHMNWRFSVATIKTIYQLHMNPNRSCQSCLPSVSQTNLFILFPISATTAILRNFRFVPSFSGQHWRFRLALPLLNLHATRWKALLRAHPSRTSLVGFVDGTLKKKLSRTHAPGIPARPVLSQEMS